MRDKMPDTFQRAHTCRAPRDVKLSFICRTVMFLVFLFLLLPRTYADEQVRSIQEELRRRRIYFGEVDGRWTPELELAVKRYQQRKGLGATSPEDRETLRSLGLIPRSSVEVPPKELEWPQEPVLKSDTRINVAAVAEQVAEETGVAPESVAPEIVGERPRTARTGKPAESALAGSRARAIVAFPPARHPASRANSEQELAPRELRDFIRDYLKALGRNDLREELSFYGDRVDYYHNGVVDRRIIERTLRDYYRRWPKRRYALDRTVDYATVPSRGEIVVTFRVAFMLKKGRTRVKGATDNRFVINAATSNPRIVKIDERRIRY